MPWDEQANLFLRKASEDQAALELLAAHASQPDSVVGFHAQQAVEKLLKALLTHRRIAFRRTHDLAELIDLYIACGGRPPSQVEDARRLQPYAVALRYEEIPEEVTAPLDRGWAVSLVQSIRRWVDEQIGKPDSQHL